jgi:drug/metabolite transporter (DMT)-like permease
MIAHYRSMVSIPFHQIMRSTCPVFTVLIYRLRYHRTFSTSTYLSLIPIILGICLATCGDYDFTIPGFLLTLLGVVLAAIKVVNNAPLPYSHSWDGC